MKNLFQITGKVSVFCVCFMGTTAAALFAQQSNMLFFMHSLPEANYINPAVQIECGYFIGLPVLSSFHMNIANSGFTLNHALEKQPDGSYVVDDDRLLSKIGNQNYGNAEVHAVLLAAGIKREDYYYTFSVSEKSSVNGLYPYDLVAFGFKGNTQFEGQWMDLSGTGVLLNYIREYALGISRAWSGRFTAGVKAKLLFGKLNIETGRNRNKIYTQENTLDLLFDMDGGFNSSIPYSLGIDNNGNYRFDSRYDGTAMEYLMNTKNPGLAFDLGFIYRYSDRLTYSGSLLDLGMVWYRSHLTNYSIRGSYLYQGPLGDSTQNENLYRDIFDELNANTDARVGYNSYASLLDPRLYLGAAYKMNRKVDLNFMVFGHLLPSKLQTGAMVSMLTRPSENLEAGISWSYMHRSPFNVGLGLAYGRSPLQVYFVSDNILGFILPMNTKNVNLRVGLNINLGCRERLDMDQCGCAWLRDAEERRTRHETIRRGKTR